jgi:hypothetical protein
MHDALTYSREVRVTALQQQNEMQAADMQLFLNHQSLVPRVPWLEDARRLPVRPEPTRENLAYMNDWQNAHDNTAGLECHSQELHPEYEGEDLGVETDTTLGMGEAESWFREKMADGD